MVDKYVTTGPAILDIRSDSGPSNEDSLAEALLSKEQESYLPKELAYEEKGMEIWTEIAKDSYQTKHELEIINETAGEIVERFLTGATIIDLGTADSQKYVPYVEAFLEKGKTCTYTALDLNPVSLEKHVLGVRNSYTKHHHIPCVGLWGTFKHGDSTTIKSRVRGCSLHLEVSSSMLRTGCATYALMSSPSNSDLMTFCSSAKTKPTSAADLALADRAYRTDAYDRFVDNYLEVLCERAGIEVVKHVREYWTVESMSPEGKHYFKITALVDMVCTNLDKFTIEAGTSYEMLPSWKRTYENIKRLVEKHDLTVTLLQKAKNSGMCQYFIQKKEKPSAVA